MPRRTLISALTQAQRQSLSAAMLTYIDANVVAEHANAHDWHHPQNGELFFSRHRDYIAKMEAFLSANGQSALVPLPKWDPATVIPPELIQVKALPGVPTTPLNANPDRPLPVNLANPCAFGTASSYARAAETWHDGVHGAVGGAMQSRSFAPAALVFWLWHAFLDDLYWDWQKCAPYQQFSLQTGTALHETDATFEFAMAEPVNESETADGAFYCAA